MKLKGMGTFKSLIISLGYTNIIFFGKNLATFPPDGGWSGAEELM